MVAESAAVGSPRTDGAHSGAETATMTMKMIQMAPSMASLLRLRRFQASLQSVRVGAVALEPAGSVSSSWLRASSACWASGVLFLSVIERTSLLLALRGAKANPGVQERVGDVHDEVDDHDKHDDDRDGAQDNGPVSLGDGAVCLVATPGQLKTVSVRMAPAIMPPKSLPM